MRTDERAVSDVVGSILMVALTLGTTVGLVLVLDLYEGPEDRTNTLLSVYQDASGNLTVSHKGGEPLDRDLTEIRVVHNGGLTVYTGGQLTGDWGDGTLTVGETWTLALGLQAGDTLSVGVIDTQHNEVLASMPLFTIR